MNKTEAKKRLEKLRAEIDHHRYLYHVLDKQEISDAALDSLKHELSQLENEFPDLITADSPSQRVSGSVLPEFKAVPHSVRMLSLNDIFSSEELTQWETRCQKIVPGKYEYFVELKIDGVALALVYEDGVLVQAATRGDGNNGEDVTQNIKTIEAIPLRLRQEFKGRIEVRGEIYMLKEDFDAMNREREKKGEALFANPRNVSAGSIRQLDPAITASRPLRFFAWEITQGRDANTRTEEYKTLQAWGFPVPPEAKKFKTVSEITDFIAKEEKRRLQYPFQVDGLVIKINDISTFTRLGVVGKAPRGAVAFKFAAEEATTVVEDIVVQVGRTGALTPVAHLQPVRVAGTTVSRATLHNADEIKRKDVRVGDTVIVRKAGDIIPEVVSVLSKLRPDHAKPFTMSTVCPVCESAIIQDPDGVVLRCSNPNCFPQQRERILHAVSRAALDIEGLGEKIIEQLLQAGLIEDAADLWELTEGDLLPLERFAEKSARNVVAEIQARKKVPLSRFLVALNIPHVGVVTAQYMARTFLDLKKVLAASEEDMKTVPGVGEKTTQEIISYLQSKDAKKLIKKFEQGGLKVMAEKTAGPLNGKTFLFTGTLPNMSRDEAKQIIQGKGGLIASAVGKGVDIIVAGEEAGSKLNKARELGLKIITPQEFLKLIAEK